MPVKRTSERLDEETSEWRVYCSAWHGQYAYLTDLEYVIKQHSLVSHPQAGSPRTSGKMASQHSGLASYPSCPRRGKRVSFLSSWAWQSHPTSLGPWMTFWHRDRPPALESYWKRRFLSHLSQALLQLQCSLSNSGSLFTDSPFQNSLLYSSRQYCLTCLHHSLTLLWLSHRSVSELNKCFLWLHFCCCFSREQGKQQAIQILIPRLH